MKELLFVCLVFLTGCSLSPGLPQLADYSDKGVLEYSNGVLTSWDTSKQDLISYGGAMSAAGLGTGTLFAAGTGSPAVTGLAFGSTMLQWMLSIFKPTDRANAWDEGAEMIRESLKKYFSTKTAAGISTVPSNCMTAYAGVLVGEVQDAINVVSRLDKKRRPKDPEPSAERTAAAPNTCGR